MTSNRLPILADEIRAAHTAAQEAQRSAIERAMEAGRALIEAKALVAHGEWLPWLKQAGIGERAARNYMAIAKSGLEIGTVADLGGIKAALEFLARWRLPSFDEALFIADSEADCPIGRGIAYVWEDDQHRGYYHVGAITGEADNEQCIATRRPMLPFVEIPGDRPVNTIIHFLTSQEFTVPIADWQLSRVERRLPFHVLPPFFGEATFREPAEGPA